MKKFLSLNRISKLLIRIKNNIKLFLPLTPSILLIFLTPYNGISQNIWDASGYNALTHTQYDVGIGITTNFTPDAQLHIKRIQCNYIMPEIGNKAFLRFELDVPEIIENSITVCSESKHIWDTKVDEWGMYFQHLIYPTINSTEYSSVTIPLKLKSDGDVVCSQNFILGNFYWLLESRWWENGDEFNIVPSNSSNTGWLTQNRFSIKKNGDIICRQNIILGENKWLLNFQTGSNSSDFFIIPRNSGDTEWEYSMGLKINNSGKVTIGNPATINNTDYLLCVDGKIVCREVVVNITAWPDYVFEKNYNIISITDLESYIIHNKHLPGIPSQSEIIQSGNNLSNTDSLLLIKIEELTLYIIDLQKQINSLMIKENDDN